MRKIFLERDHVIQHAHCQSWLHPSLFGGLLFASDGVGIGAWTAKAIQPPKEVGVQIPLPHPVLEGTECLGHRCPENPLLCDGVCHLLAAPSVELALRVSMVALNNVGGQGRKHTEVSQELLQLVDSCFHACFVKLASPRNVAKQNSGELDVRTARTLLCLALELGISCQEVSGLKVNQGKEQKWHSACGEFKPPPVVSHSLQGHLEIIGGKLYGEIKPRKLYEALEIVIDQLPAKVASDVGLKDLTGPQLLYYYDYYYILTYT